MTHNRGTTLKKKREHQRVQTDTTIGDIKRDRDLYAAESKTIPGATIDSDYQIISRLMHHLLSVASLAISYASASMVHDKTRREATTQQDNTSHRAKVSYI